MSATSPAATASSLAKDRLGVFSVIMFAMTAATPLLVVGGLVVSGWAGFAITGLPLAFVLLAIVLAIFSAGYVAMARHVVNAGPFYSYIALGANKTLGVGASFVAVLAYNFLQIGIYGILGVTGSEVLSELFGRDVKWWICALVGWAVVGVMGALRVDISSKILGVLLLLEIVLVIVFDAFNLTNPAPGSVSFAAFDPKNLFVTGVGAAFAVVITAYIGFEAAPVFSEEARHAGKTVPAATYLALAVMMVVYAITTWAMTVSVGDGKIVDYARQNGPDTIFNIAHANMGGGNLIPNLGHVLLLTSVFAGAVSYHNAVARYTFALGREHVLPPALGRTRAGTGAPIVASLTQTLLALVVIVLYATNGWDPMSQLFFWFGATGGFGILILLIGTSLSVIKFFARDHLGESIWARVIAPALAAIGLGYVFYETVTAFATLLGVSSDAPIAWIMPCLYALVAAVGIVRALALRNRRRPVYDAIGLGARATEPAQPAVVALPPANPPVPPANRQAPPANRPAPRPRPAADDAADAGDADSGRPAT
jgi:amino acid transporter